MMTKGRIDRSCDADMKKDSRISVSQALIWRSYSNAKDIVFIIWPDISWLGRWRPFGEPLFFSISFSILDRDIFSVDMGDKILLLGLTLLDLNG